MDNLRWRYISRKPDAYVRPNTWSRLDMEHPTDRADLEQTPGCVYTRGNVNGLSRKFNPEIQTTLLLTKCGEIEK